MTSEIEGMTLDDWKLCSWWPNGRNAQIMAGFAGHEHEIVVNIDGYDHHEQIPKTVGSVFLALCPESWTVDNRGTRLEVHPSGRRYAGWHRDDITAVERAIEQMGLVVGEVHVKGETT